MLLYFPRNLAGLVALASRHEGRYATGALHVLDPGDGTYRVEVTDGRRLAIVRGPNAGACYPVLADAHDEDDGDAGEADLPGILSSIQIHDGPPMTGQTARPAIIQNHATRTWAATASSPTTPRVATCSG